MSVDPEIETALRSLPALDVETSKGGALGRHARAQLLHHTQQHPLVRRFSALWDSVLEPALVVAVMVVYSSWGLGIVDGLFTGRQ